MEGMFTFVGIIIIVFGVLQIILFFKMWGMTNDVGNINSKLHEAKDENKEYELLMISGKDEAVYQILTNKLSKDIHEAYQSFSESYYEKEVKRLLGIYKPKFLKIGKEIPDHLLKCSSNEYIKALLN